MHPVDSETGKENKEPAGNPGGSPEKPASGPFQLIMFVLIFIAILTFMFYVIGIYDIK